MWKKEFRIKSHTLIQASIISFTDSGLLLALLSFKSYISYQLTSQSQLIWGASRNKNSEVYFNREADV